MAKPIDKHEIIADSWIEWGTVPQMTQLIEEMCELSVEINKKYIRHKSNDEALIEEFGDVLAMMDQVRYILSKTIKNFDERLNKSMDEKWRRTRRRVEASRKKRNEKLL